MVENIFLRIATRHIILSVSCHFNFATPVHTSKVATMSSDAPAGRPMKYPYTFSAKIAQFPYKFYINNNWVARYFLFGVAISVPIFYKIHSMANSPGNVSTWAEIKRKEAAAHH